MSYVGLAVSKRQLISLETILTSWRIPVFKSTHPTIQSRIRHHHQACCRTRRERVGPRPWSRTSWTKLSVFEDVRDNYMLCTSLHLLKVDADFHLWILRWFPISFSYSVPYWFPLSQVNSHFGCARLYWHQSSASCNWYVVCSSSTQVIPCASLRVVFWSVFRDAWFNIWPNFRRILRKERHRRQLSVNRCHTRLASSHEPIGKKWTHQTGWFDRQNLVLGYLAQAELQSLSLHQNAWQVGPLHRAGPFESFEGWSVVSWKLATSCLDFHHSFPNLLLLTLRFFCQLLWPRDHGLEGVYVCFAHIALVKCFWEIWNLWNTRELTKHSMKTLQCKCARRILLLCSNGLCDSPLMSALFGLKEW